MQKLFPSKQSLRWFEVKDKLYAVLWITFFWLLLAVYQYTDRYAMLATNACVDPDYQHGPHLRGLIITITLAGLFVATGLVFLWERWLRKMAYLSALGYIILFYTIFYILLTALATVSLTLQDPGAIIADSLFKTVVSSIINIYAIPTFLFWLFICLLTILFLLMRDKFGPTTFTEFLTGKYFRPQREERIFMFMDLKSSTTIAEQLGEDKYFNFLNDTFKCVTPAILSTQGEIYQYVGDEIVVSWKTKKGFSQANCIQCFYEMMDLIKNKSEYFRHQYGVQPKFKAGLHYGPVIAGEMGIIKREIVYSGDVLNTASRIQSLCNEMKTDILISKHLIDQVDTMFMAKKIKSMGIIDLRGKQEKVELVTLLHPN